eukprot:g3851.t1
MPIKLDFRQIIFVMEDVDAASDVVLKRAEAKAAKAMDDDDDDEDLGENVALLLAMLASANEVETVGSGSGGDSGGSGSGGKASGSPFGPMKVDKTDELNLSGMLNVLDGVVDCPGRIVIMTSNHPEKLDPALVRPGRVNLKLYLGYIELDEACSMIALYFLGPPTAAQRQDLQGVWTAPGRREYTPAQLEQLCAESDTIDDLVAVLQQQHREHLEAKAAKEAKEQAGE